MNSAVLSYSWTEMKRFPAAGHRYWKYSYELRNAPVGMADYAYPLPLKKERNFGANASPITQVRDIEESVRAVSTVTIFSLLVRLVFRTY